MKARIITLSILISLLSFSLNQNIKVTTIEPAADIAVAVAEPISIATKGFDYFSIKPVVTMLIRRTLRLWVRK